MPTRQQRESDLMTSADVAKKLTRSIDWFYRNRKRLEASGFPKTVPGFGKRWHPGAVAAFLAREAGRPVVESGTVEIDAEDDAAWQKYLDARAEKIAGEIKDPW